MKLLCITIYAVSFVLSEINHPLKRKLSTWHVLKKDDIYMHRSKRSLDEDKKADPVDKQISFNAFEQPMLLSLLVSPEVLAPQFKAYALGRSKSNEIIVDKSTLMKGTVMGDPHSSVVAHYDGKMLTANIRTKNETYVVEPMWRHMPQNAKAAENTTNVPKLEHSDMIVYRLSDVNLTAFKNPHGRNGFCQSEKLMESIRGQQRRNDLNKSSTTNSSTHHRSRRSTSVSTKKICKLSLFADYRFYRYMGNNSTLETLYYLISLIERVNAIYKNTYWDSESELRLYSGYGFQINNITIHTEPSRDDDPSPDLKYNKAVHWEAKDLLDAFSEVNNSICLSHLFTYIDFPEGLLGLAYVGSQNIDDVGGICSKSYFRSGKTMFLNSGLTSTVNWNERILTTEADLVTAHELGHNFGAVHDDETQSHDKQSCTPGQAHGGNYIMYPAAVSGQYPNNNKFSDCSKHAILPVLKNKADLCFQEDSKTFCGNYKVEPENNETCDVGLFATDDPCCRSDCQLKRGAKCSSKNDPCCSDDCQIANTKKLCRAEIQGLCFKKTYCNGVDKTCPAEEPVVDGKACGDGGKCKNGTCQQFCTTEGKRPCLCTEKEYQCKRCCASANATKKSGDFDCKPFRNKTTGELINLKENAICIYGYCNQGECQKHTQDVIEVVWDFFKYIAPDKIGEFLADNIVGAVLVFSLLFWIPCSCLINFVDKKRLLERQKEEKWLTERADVTRSFGGFRSVAGGSAPNTPRLRVSLNNTNRISGGIALGGAREQWRVSQDKGMAYKQSRENVQERLSAVPGSPNEEPDVFTHSQPSLVNVGSNITNDNFLSTGPTALSRSHPSLTSSLSPNLNDQSLGLGMKPIAVSSNANLPSLDESECSIRDDISAVQYRRNLKRQEAVTSPLD